MILLSELREAITEICATIPEIHKNKTVETETAFANELRDHAAADNTMLLCVAPEYHGFKTKDDVPGYYTFLQFFILNKIDYKKTKTIDEITLLQPIVQKFLSAIEDYMNENDCPFFGNIDMNDNVIRTHTNDASCCGWEIQLTDKTYTGFDGRTG